MPNSAPKTAILRIPYEYLNADQVAALQRRARSDRAWETMNWGSFGRNGMTGLNVKTLGECDTDHLEAILITQPQISPEIRATILELLKERYVETQTQMKRDDGGDKLTATAAPKRPERRNEPARRRGWFWTFVILAIIAFVLSRLM